VNFDRNLNQSHNLSSTLSCFLNVASFRKLVFSEIFFVFLLSKFIIGLMRDICVKSALELNAYH